MSETTTTTTTTSVVSTMVAQIGRWNVLATSGGRVLVLDENTVKLPVHYGYAVEVKYDPGWDLYTVRRTLTRGAKRTVKGSVDRVFAEDLGEMVYRAGCYRDPFGGHNP